jgi:hypothetical protein
VVEAVEVRERLVGDLLPFQVQADDELRARKAREDRRGVGVTFDGDDVAAAGFRAVDPRPLLLGFFEARSVRVGHRHRVWRLDRLGVFGVDHDRRLRRRLDLHRTGGDFHLRLAAGQREHGGEERREGDRSGRAHGVSPRAVKGRTGLLDHRGTGGERR